MTSVSVSDWKATPFCRSIHLFQLPVVLHDAVMDKNNPAGLVGMGIDLRGPPVGGPADVSDAGRSIYGDILELFGELVKFAFRTIGLDLALVEGCHARGVIAPVLQTFEPFD